MFWWVDVMLWGGRSGNWWILGGAEMVENDLQKKNDVLTNGGWRMMLWWCGVGREKNTKNPLFYTAGCGPRSSVRSLYVVCFSTGCGPQSSDVVCVFNLKAGVQGSLSNVRTPIRL